MIWNKYKNEKKKKNSLMMLFVSVKKQEFKVYDGKKGEIKAK